MEFFHTSSWSIRVSTIIRIEWLVPIKNKQLGIDEACLVIHLENEKNYFGCSSQSPVPNSILSNRILHGP